MVKLRHWLIYACLVSCLRAFEIRASIHGFTILFHWNYDSAADQTLEAYVHGITRF